MITNKVFITNDIQENCYIVSDETKDAVIIDCGCFFDHEWEPIRNYIQKEGLKPKHLLNTHLHFDHAMGNHFVYKDFGLKPEASEKDNFLYTNMALQLKLFLGTDKLSYSMPSLLRNLKDGDKITFGNHTLDVIETPGHTPGGLCFICKDEDIMWCGDTIFMGSIGRTDLEGGDYQLIIKSIREKISCLPEQTKLFTGHGSPTTIAHEKMFNPYF